MVTPLLLLLLLYYHVVINLHLFSRVCNGKFVTRGGVSRATAVQTNELKSAHTVMMPYVRPTPAEPEMGSS